MNEIEILKLLIAVAGPLAEAIKRLDESRGDASEVDRDAAVTRLQDTAEAVKKRLAAMD